MIINLLSDIKNLTARENTSLLDFLTRIQLKGKLEGIILEVMNEREGLVELDGNKIRVSLPEGAKKGDKVTIKAERKEEDVILKLDAKDNKKLTIKAPVKVKKEEVFHIKIPEKINIKETLSNLKKEVLDLKGETLKSEALNETVEKIEKLVDSYAVKINKDTLTKDLPAEIKKYVKDSGMNFESRLKDAAYESDETKNLNEKLTELKNDVKFKTNNIINELETEKQSLEQKSDTMNKIHEIIKHVTEFKADIDNLDSSKSGPFAKSVRSFASLVNDLLSQITKINENIVMEMVDILVDVIDFMGSNDMLTTELMGEFTSIVKEIEDVLANISDVSLEMKDSGIKERDGLESAVKLIKAKISELQEKLLSKETMTDKQPVDTREETEIVKESVKLQDKEGLVILSRLKKTLSSLITELKKAEADLKGTSTKPIDEAIKKIETIIKSLNKLIDGIEYQQLSNLKSAEGGVNYFMMPVLFDGAMIMPEIVITSKRHKKNVKEKSDNESRIEIFVDLKSSGHIRADFNVIGRNIAGDFFCVREDTVKDIKESLAGLKESLNDRDFNVIRLGCRKTKKAKHCEVKPEDKLTLEDINVFDFKV